mgnify:CR=1 FL=1
MPWHRHKGLLRQVAIAAGTAIAAVSAWELTLGQQRGQSNAFTRLRAAVSSGHQSHSDLSDSADERKFIDKFSTAELPSISALSELVVLAVHAEPVLQYVVRNRGAVPAVVCKIRTQPLFCSWKV